jgi:hypothetical protein
MSPLIPLTAAAAAALLLYGRIRRLSSKPQRSYWGNPRPRALAEAVASALTVLLVGKILIISMDPAPAYTQPVFATLAIGIAISQFLKSLRAPRALITVRR